MTQNAISLEISDDEGKIKSDDRGKENIDPNELSVPITRSMAASASIVKVPRVTRKDMMTDEPRTPLGDLNAADYYAEGLDATSVILVQEDEVTVAEPEAVKAQVVEEAFLAEAVTITDSPFTFNASVNTEKVKMTTVQVGALLMASAPVWDTETVIESPTAGDAGGEIEIWESESAKDENEEKENMGVFALAEL